MPHVHLALISLTLYVKTYHCIIIFFNGQDTFLSTLEIDINDSAIVLSMLLFSFLNDVVDVDVFVFVVSFVHFYSVASGLPPSSIVFARYIKADSQCASRDFIATVNSSTECVCNWTLFSVIVIYRACS